MLKSFALSILSSSVYILRARDIDRLLRPDLDRDVPTVETETSVRAGDGARGGGVYLDRFLCVGGGGGE